jgi:hypothetical protein
VEDTPCPEWTVDEQLVKWTDVETLVREYEARLAEVTAALALLHNAVKGLNVEQNQHYPDAKAVDECETKVAEAMDKADAVLAKGRGI